jgi:hypothetical protein
VHIENEGFRPEARAGVPDIILVVENHPKLVYVVAIPENVGFVSRQGL